MKLKLRSDFSDYYDHHFDREGQVFERMSRTGMDRLAMLDTLYHEMRLPVPTYGPAKHAIGDGAAAKGEMWVVHQDPFAHRGEGKVVLAGSVIRERYDDDATVVRYIEGARGRSLRHLQVGNRAWLLTYESANDWRSNCGDVTIRVGGTCHPMTRARWPLFAVDFVRDEDGELYAVDLNTSPGLKGTGMEGELKPAEVVRLIKAWVEQHPADQSAGPSRVRAGREPGPPPTA
jgi:hypothetical protein